MRLAPTRTARAVLLLALTLCLQPPLPAVALEPGHSVRLETQGLDLRRAPLPDARVIGRPGPGTPLRVVAVRGGWVQLVDAAGRAPAGWVELAVLSALLQRDDTRTAGTGGGMRLTRGGDGDDSRAGQRSFLNAPFAAPAAPVSPPEPAPSLPQPWPEASRLLPVDPLSVAVARFDCLRASEAGQGLAGCTLRLSLRLDIAERYAPYLAEETAVRCAASLAFTSLGGDVPGLVVEERWTTLPVREGSGGGTAVLRFDFSLEPDPVLSAEVADVACQPER